MVADVGTGFIKGSWDHFSVSNYIGAAVGGAVNATVTVGTKSSVAGAVAGSAVNL